MPSISLIIPTYNRYDDLSICILSILKQTRLPDELIIIDDGELDNIPHKADCEKSGIQVIYHKKDSPGLTASRNCGVRLAKHTLIFFLDDDVELFPEYIQSITDVFEEDSQGKIGGVGGVIANEPKLSLTKKIRRAFDMCFLVTGPTEGKVLCSGFCVNFGSSGKTLTNNVYVDFLSGGVCAYRKSVFDTVMFDENYQGYGLGEDKDFSYRLSKHTLLVMTPYAKLNHYESPQMRFDKQKLGFESIVSRYRFFRTHVYTSPITSIPFYFALFGFTLSRLIIAALSFKKAEFNRLYGVFSAIYFIISGQAKAALAKEKVSGKS